jgi:hypothetical protein
MAGFIPAIYALLYLKDVDARHRAGHDEEDALIGKKGNVMA